MMTILEFSDLASFSVASMPFHCKKAGAQRAMVMLSIFDEAFLILKCMCEC